MAPLRQTAHSLDDSIGNERERAGNIAVASSLAEKLVVENDVEQ